MNRAPRRERRRIDGVLLLDKPLGLSSNAALQRVKRLFNAEKAGHSGTLDPLATGLLPILLGEATKFGAFLLDSDKTYVADLRFGIRTSTGDAEGEVLAQKDVAFDRSQLDAAVDRFLGPILQVPPMYSALKRAGRALYEYARAGETLERAAREVSIHDLRVLDFSPFSTVLSVRCSKGTYIRTLAEDIGEVLGCGAHLSALKRVGAGPFRIENAIGLADLEGLSEAERGTFLLPLDVLLGDLPALELDADQTRRFCQGQTLQGDWPRLDRAKILGDGGSFLGVGSVDEEARLHPGRLLRN